MTNYFDTSQDTATLDNPSALTPLPSIGEQPSSEPVQPPDEGSNVEQDATASIFADPQDIRRYKMARLHGASEQEALKVGDNGIGFKGDVTATYKVPQVALPPDTPGFQYGRLVRVTGPKGSVVARLTDKMPSQEQLKGDANIDLNPATAMAVGHPGGTTPVKWQYVTGTGDVQQTPNLTEPRSIQIASGPQLQSQYSGAPSSELPSILNPIGELPTEGDASGLVGEAAQEAPPIEEPVATTSQTQNEGATPPIRSVADNAKLVKSRNDGGYEYDDGTILYRDLTQVKEYDGVKYIKRFGEKWQKMGGASSQTKPPEQIAVEAAARRGILRSNYPTGPEGDVQFRKALAPPKIFRDTTSGLAFDISDTQNPKPLNLPGNPASVDTNSIKQGDWSSVPEDLRDVAQNIAQYKYPKLSGFALRSPYFQQMFKIISKVDPAFNYQQYDARQKFLSDFSGTGKMGQNRLAFNTALDHMNTALDSSEELRKVYDADQITNKMVIGSKTLAGDTALGKYQSDAHEVAKELARAFTGAAPTVEGIKTEQADLVGGSMTILNAAQRQTAIKEKAKLLGSRLGEMARLYESTMKKPLDIALVSPEAEHTLRRLGLNELAEKYGTQGGKRSYADPQVDAHAVTPFPGSEQDTGTGQREIVEDGQGNRFIVSPDGKLIPYAP